MAAGRGDFRCQRKFIKAKMSFLHLYLLFFSLNAVWGRQGHSLLTLCVRSDHVFFRALLFKILIKNPINIPKYYIGYSCFTVVFCYLFYPFW